jgi:crotonobetainyl-CoA:carnitine CoA-transferase CaiB-like acyl-CoA transferase
MSVLPLAGITVLDLSRLLPGPFCSLMLADFGADVIKVEDTGMGDYVRWSGPAVPGVEKSARSVRFLALNRNKRSVRLDLKSEGGKSAFLTLVRQADVVLESFRPGVLERLGLGHEVLRAQNPGLVVCAISGYGADGPMAQRAGHDMNYLGQVGLLALTGDVDSDMVPPGAPVADIGGGALMGVVGILVALRHRDRTGEGQFVDIAMADGALSWLGMDAAAALMGEPPRRGRLTLGGNAVCYRPYRCRDGWVTMGAVEPKFFAAWCHGVGREELVDAQFEEPGSAAHAEICAIFAARTRAEWAAFAVEHDCCVEPVLELDEALSSEQVLARGMVVEIDQPGAEAPVKMLGVPVRMSHTPGDPRRLPAPSLGEHTVAVLEQAGLASEEIDALLASGAAAGPPDAAISWSFLP